MKKKLVCCLSILALTLFQMPAFAINYSSWSGLVSAFNFAGLDLGAIPIDMDKAIVAPAGSKGLVNWNCGLTTNFGLDYDLTGGGDDHCTIKNKKLGNLSIWGGDYNDSSIKSGGSGHSIVNNGDLVMSNVTLVNGLRQSECSGSSLLVGVLGGHGGGEVVLSGKNEITTGEIGIQEQGFTLTFDGGTIDKGAYLNLNGTGAYGQLFEILDGNVTFNGSGDATDVWTTPISLPYKDQGKANLTLDKFSHTAENYGGYSQASGTLNLTNGSKLELLADSKILTDEKATTTVNIGGGTDPNTVTLNGASITNSDNGGITNINIGAGSNKNILNVSNASSSIKSGKSGYTNLNVGVGASTGNSLVLSAGSIAGAGTTVNVGTTTSGSKDNVLAVSGGTLDTTATVIINPNNSLKISGGNVSLNGSGCGVDTWSSSGKIELSNGNLNLMKTVKNGLYNQTGGTTSLNGVLSLTDKSNLSAGSLVNNLTLNITNNKDKTVATSLSGNGTINKDGAGNLLISGNNTAYKGVLYLNQGTVTFASNASKITVVDSTKKAK